MQALSPDISRLQGCNLSLWTVGDLPTVKPEATTTSCRYNKINNKPRNQGLKLRK